MGTESTTHTKEPLSGWLVAVVTTIVVVAAYHVFMKEKDTWPVAAYNTMPVAYTGFSGEDRMGGSFSEPAEAAVNATVHITTKINQTANNHPDESYPVGGIFGSPAFPQTGSGSGALISEDGYIVTNHHVIAGASQISVTLANGSVSSARLVGTDSVNDLAVLKIPVRRLPFLLYGNSDELKTGQWVLAVGYPLNLQSTVTAGIVSAKGKNLELSVRGYNSIKMQSYIQTDAVVNHGSSGGPLINTTGRLVGINAYLASPTGVYSGYSFTIPVNTVKRVVNGIIRKSLPPINK